MLDNGWHSQQCHSGWTSMHGRVAFWIRMTRPSSVYHSGLVRGEVCFKLYKQKCTNCQSGRFQQAMWYAEEIAHALSFLYLKVGELFYGRPPTGVTRGIRQVLSQSNLSFWLVSLHKGSSGFITGKAGPSSQAGIVSSMSRRNLSRQCQQSFSSFSCLITSFLDWSFIALPHFKSYFN